MSAPVPDTPGCGHERYGAKLGCPVCVKRVREKYGEFPLQMDRDTRVRPGPMSIPWAVADKAWAAYHQRWGSDQSVERLAERGGFSWGEMDQFFPGWRDATDEWRKLRAELEAAQARLRELEPPTADPLAEAWVHLSKASARFREAGHPTLADAMEAVAAAVSEAAGRRHEVR